MCAWVWIYVYVCVHAHWSLSLSFRTFALLLSSQLVKHSFRPAAVHVQTLGLSRCLPLQLICNSSTPAKRTPTWTKASSPGRGASLATPIYLAMPLPSAQWLCHSPFPKTAAIPPFQRVQATSHRFSWLDSYQCLTLAFCYLASVRRLTLSSQVGIALPQISLRLTLGPLNWLLSLSGMFLLQFLNSLPPQCFWIFLRGWFFSLIASLVILSKIQP